MQVVLENVSKSFGGQVALAPLTLAIPENQALVLIGPSGCGKSTTLRLIAGLLKPDTGAVLFDGVPMRRDTAQELRKKMGYVIQDGGLFPHLTAAQNTAIVARECGWKEERIRDRMAELAELVHIPRDLLERYPLQLSGGQRQRVGMMRALMLDPPFLLMDEPLGALDPIIRSQLQEDLREIFTSLHKTVLLVTHDLGEAAFLGDRIALMRAGRIVQMGTAEDLLERPADPFVTEFIQAQRPLWSLAEAGV